MNPAAASVLLVTRAFPPYAPSLGGAVRMLKLAEYLRDQGVEVHVLAGKGRHYGDYGYGELLKTIRVHYVPDPLMARSGPPLAGEAASANGGLRAWLRPLVTECSLPDTGIFAVPRLSGVANELIAKHRFANIITSGPPHSDHLIGLRAKRKFGAAINWIVDYRDSWNGTSLFRKNNRVLQHFNLALEKTVLRRADHLTYISEPMIEKVVTLLGAAGKSVRDKSTLVMNGYDVRHAPDVSSWVAQGSRLRIGYFGLLDDRPESYRNPTGLFETVMRHNLEVSLEMYGQIRISPHWSELMGDRLTVGGLLPHAESVARMAGMDALMLLHTRQDGADEVLTGKIFEYLLSGRPVLSVGPAQMAANRLLCELATGYSIPHDDPDALVATLRELLKLKSAGRLASRLPAGIARFSREYQYARIKDLLSVGPGPKA